MVLRHPHGRQRGEDFGQARAHEGGGASATTATWEIGGFELR